MSADTIAQDDRGQVLIVSGCELLAGDVSAFLSKLKRNHETGCLEWTSSTDPHGYGRFRLKRNGKSVHVGAHKIAFVLAHGYDPLPLCVLHKCDNRICCDDRHLFAGTRKYNHDDAKSKARHSHGERHGMHKLTEAIVRQIRTSERGSAALAEHFGISRDTVREIRRFRTWKHVSLVEVSQ